MKLYFYAVLACAFILTACAGGPIRRSQNAIGVPRTVHIDSNAIKNPNLEKKFSLLGGLGYNYGVSWTNQGDSFGSSNYLGKLELRFGSVFAGWMPFYSVSHVSMESTIDFGAQGYLGATLIFGTWALMPQVAFTGATNFSSDKDCDGNWSTLFFSCDPKGKTYLSKVQTKLRESSISLPLLKKLSDSSALWLSGSLHRTKFQAENTLSSDPARDTFYTQSSTSYSVLAGYAYKGEEHALYTLAFGASQAKSFGPRAGRKQWHPSADFRIQF